MGLLENDEDFGRREVGCLYARIVSRRRRCGNEL